MMPDVTGVRGGVLLLLLLLCLLIEARAVEIAGEEILQDLPIIRMVFNYTDPDPDTTTTTITMCSDNTLSETPETTVVTVVFETPDKSEQVVVGQLLDEPDTKCAQFDMAYRVPGNSESTAYTFIVRISNDPGDPDTVKTSSAMFPMTEVIALCTGQKFLTRVSWTDSGTTMVEESYSCIAPEPSDDQMFCYIEGDKTTDELCFTNTESEDIEICRVGGVATAGDAEQISVNYLAYDQSEENTAQTQLSLMFNGDTNKNLEVTLWGLGDDGPPQVLVCDEAPCTLTSFVPSKGKVYEMCAFLDKSLLKEAQSGYTSITDVNLVAYDLGEDPSLIEFGFANLNEDSFLYVGSLSAGVSDSTEADDSVRIDCTGVAPTHTCFGFISPEQLTSSEGTYLSVQYTNGTYQSPSNRIASKVQLLPSDEGNFNRLKVPRA